MASSSVDIVSKCTIYPGPYKSAINESLIKLSVSDLPMLSFQYIQKGVLLPQTPLSSPHLLSLLKLSLSKALSHFPPLAGRLHTGSDGHVYILCNDSGVDFFHAKAPHLSISDLLPPPDCDIPAAYRSFFQYDNTLNYAGHSIPLVAVQLTELNDAVFVGCSVNHAVVDGTSFWNFFNTFAEMARGSNTISKPPVFRRDAVFDTTAVLTFPGGGAPSLTSSGDEPLREKLFHFSREAIMELKIRANNSLSQNPQILGNLVKKNPRAEISSFQSLCALMWRSVTRVRNLDPNKTTTFRMPANCRHRLEPPLEPLYFGNAFQRILSAATVREILSNDLNWVADRLHQNVLAHDDATVRHGVRDWERNPRLFQLGNLDGETIAMGSSPRFPTYDNDFGWGVPLAVRSGRANKCDGISYAFPGPQGNGSIDLEVTLVHETMPALENNSEFMQYIS